VHTIEICKKVRCDVFIWVLLEKNAIMRKYIKKEAISWKALVNSAKKLNVPRKVGVFFTAEQL
jgi:hypothetical protein